MLHVYRTFPILITCIDLDKFMNGLSIDYDQFHCWNTVTFKIFLRFYLNIIFLFITNSKCEKDDIGILEALDARLPLSLDLNLQEVSAKKARYVYTYIYM